MKPASAGLALGILVAAAAIWLVHSLLAVNWQTAVASFVAAPVLLATAAVLACLTAALRAVRTDPADTLRSL